MRINSGGAGSAGDTKTYDAESLIAAANARAKHYQSLRSQFHTLRAAFNQIADLGIDFQGKGADAIKKFYAAQVNVVDAWLRMIDKQIAYYHGVAGTIDDKNLGGDTQVQVPFLDEDLSRGYARSKEMVREQRDDIAKILSGISDLVPINVFSNHDVDQALDASEQKRAKMVLDVQDLDQNLTNEYRQVTDDLPYIASLYGELINATGQGADVQPMHFNAQAYHDSKIYQVQDEMKKTTQSYLQYKKQQETVRGMEKQREAEVNRPWYKKAGSAIATFAGELSGYYDYLRAVQGIDPETGRKLSAAERVEAGAMAASTFIPIIGWGGRIAKGGEALYKTAKGLEAAGQSLKAYDQASRTLKVLSTSEKGINALLAGNGVIEASTGRDMFGKPLTEEQRKNSLLQGIMMMNAFSRGKLVSNEEKIAVGEQAKAFKEHVNTLIQQTKDKIGSHKLKPAMAGASDELSQLTDDVRKTHTMEKADGVGKISEKSEVIEKSHVAEGMWNGNNVSGEDVYGPYYDEAKKLHESNPEWYPNPDESTIVKGKELKEARADYQALVRRGELEKGHHIQGLAFGGENVTSNIKITGESTIRSDQIDDLNLDFYHEMGYGKKDAKILKIHENEEGIILFGNNSHHTQVTTFQNKVLKWQREDGRR
ncbi:ribonuclease YeeF family protein [Sporolactobacillus laevolacticus]|uniref:ribonuclease YeeF family protein n=1 Tax=Sporolactobacillus laevolacticus TaxID=33018 RepID=UPI0025B62254|nr:T7SS effector LXG polymorphic toxin [Sporolactobacillus laevolacticus]MDN3955968.1 T7SS effector LXG polymorphic toxin [Sporolactobacillus laevolacticus]